MSLIPFIRDDDHFFDSIFDDMNRDIARMHHDMRCAMSRLAPRDPLSVGGDSNHLQQLQLLREPIVTKDDGSKEMRLRFDLGNFKPEEISVKTKDGELHVEAKHEEKTDNSRVFHHFSRHFTVPKGVDEDKMTSSLSKDGVLVVRGPVRAEALQDAQEIPVLKDK